MDNLRLHIISPEREIYSGEVQKVLLPGGKAPFMVLVRHAPIISTLTRGKIKFTSADGVAHEQKVTGGFVEVKKNVVTVCIE